MVETLTDYIYCCEKIDITKTYYQNKLIKSTDIATTAELMSALNGYSIGTGNMVDSIALKDGFVTIKLKEEYPLTIGYIKCAL